MWRATAATADGDKKVSRKKKRFTYRSFAQRVATLDTKVFRKVGAARAEPAAGAETFFQVRCGGRTCRPMPPTFPLLRSSAACGSRSIRAVRARRVAMQGWNGHDVERSTMQYTHGLDCSPPAFAWRTHHRKRRALKRSRAKLYRKPSTSGGSSTRPRTS